MPINPKEYIGPNFKYNEFRCKCCGQLPPEGIDPNLILKLEILRMLLGDKPIIISSGYRCPAHNKAVNGAPESQHLYGKAADILVKGGLLLLSLQLLSRFSIMEVLAITKILFMSILGEIKYVGNNSYPLVDKVMFYRLYKV